MTIYFKIEKNKFDTNNKTNHYVYIRLNDEIYTIDSIYRIHFKRKKYLTQILTFQTDFHSSHHLKFITILIQIIFYYEKQ